MIVTGSRTKTGGIESNSPSAQLAPPDPQAIAKAKPKTWVQVGGTQKEPFKDEDRTVDKLKKYRNIMDQGGLVATGLELYPLFILANGYKFVGDKSGEIQAWADAINFDSILWQGITDAIWSGDAFQENVGTRGTALEIARLEAEGNVAELAKVSKSADVIKIAPRDPTDFRIEIEQTGNVKGYTQVQDQNTGKGVSLKPEQITHLVLIHQSGSPYGRSMVKRAYDDIMRDVTIASASTEAINRHGFKKYHVSVGQTGEVIEEPVMTAISNKFQDIEAKQEWVTCADVKIENIDTGGLEQIDKYNDISLSRVCAAIGIPEELLGLRKGSTDATAVSRIKAFFKKIQTFQRAVAQCYNVNVFDRKTGKPGSVKLVFNDPDPEDKAIKAGWISQILKSSPAEPFAVLPVAYIQQEFDIDTGEWGISPAPKDAKVIKDSTTIPEKPVAKEPVAPTQ
jgi:hypothetical protein